MIKDELRGAVARGWCQPETETIEMDVVLGEAIVEEVWKLFTDGDYDGE